MSESLALFAVLAWLIASALFLFLMGEPSGAAGVAALTAPVLVWGIIYAVRAYKERDP